MARDDKTCVMCNKHYKFCESCPSKYNITETWRNIFCSENCRSLYKVYDQIKAGQIADKNAIKAIKKLDISYIQNINDPMKSVLNVLLNSNKSKTETDVIESKIENNSDETNITGNTNELQLNKRLRSKSKIKKRNNEVG